MQKITIVSYPAYAKCQWEKFSALSIKTLTSCTVCVLELPTPLIKILLLDIPELKSKMAHNREEFPDHR